MLPNRRPKAEKAKREKRESRWRSPAHTKWVSEFDCCYCGSRTNVKAAHVRLGSHTGMSQKPDDWRTVPLCDGPNADINGELGCHDTQHRTGEKTFWKAYSVKSGQTVDELLDDLCKASPKRAEIALAQRSRALAFAGEE